jgi:hypothetical protein
MNGLTDFDSIRQIFSETLDKSTSFEDWMIRIAKEIHYIGFNDGMLAQATHDKFLIEEIVEDIKAEIKEYARCQRLEDEDLSENEILHIIDRCITGKE